MPQDQDDIKGADAMKQAPTPGTLTSESVKLLAKGDLLRVTNADSFLEANGVKDGSVVRFRSADNTWIDLQEMDFPQGSSFARFAFIGRPDESGWMPWSGGENPVPGRWVQVRQRAYQLDDESSWFADQQRWTDTGHAGDIIAFRLAPTAPVEASGSERDQVEHLAKTLDKSPDEIRRALANLEAKGLIALRPQPSGETREAEQMALNIICDPGIITGLHTAAEARDWIEKSVRAALLSKKKPTSEEVDARRRLINLIEQWDGESEYDAEDCASLADDILHAFNGSPVLSSSALGYVSADAEAALKAGINRVIYPAPSAHASFPLYAAPVPAQDDDKLRSALTDLVSWFDKPIQGERGMVWVIRAGDQGADDAVAEALAALKAEGK